MARRHVIRSFIAGITATAAELIGYSDSTANYTSAAEDVDGAISALDTQVKVNADGVATNVSALSALGGAIVLSAATIANGTIDFVIPTGIVDADIAALSLVFYTGGDTLIGSYTGPGTTGVGACVYTPDAGTTTTTTSAMTVAVSADKVLTVANTNIATTTTYCATLWLV